MNGFIPLDLELERKSSHSLTEGQIVLLLWLLLLLLFSLVLWTIVYIVTVSVMSVKLCQIIINIMHYELKL